MTESQSSSTGKTALITGGAIRVGRALAESCAELGYRLVIHYGSSHRQAQELSAHLKQRDVEHCLVQANFAEEDAAQRLFAAIPPRFRPIELLINSAAIFPEQDNLNSAAENWSSIMTINARTPIMLMQQMALQQMDKPMQIINVLDARLSHAQGDHLVYRWSKALLQQATLDLAKSLAPKARVNAIALGAILPPPGKGEAHLERLAERIPLQTTGDLQQVKQALAYLVRQSFVTGEILRLDGGEFL